MRTYDISRPPELINIGFDGENKWRPRGFNCTDWLQKHPDGIITLWIQPEGVKKAFPVSTTKMENTIVWHPLSEELYPGTGKLQLVIQDGEYVGKSDAIKFEVNKSLVSGGAHPDSQPSWATKVVDDVTAQANRAEEAARTATDTAEDIASTIMELIPEAIDDYFDEHPIEITETDPTVPSWAKAAQKPSYTAAEVGALPDSYTPPVQSVNGKTGAVVLDASDVGAYVKPSGGIPASDLAAGVIPDISGKVDKVTGYGLVSSRDVTNGYELAINENGTVTNLPVVAISSYNTAMQQASQALAAKANAADVYTKTEIDSKGYQTAAQVQGAIAPLQTKAITDTGNYYTTDTVEGALQEIGGKLLPSGGSTGDFLRKTASGAAWQAVPSAESNSFGGGS